jgi:hypothetical protein
LFEPDAARMAAWTPATMSEITRTISNAMQRIGK